jgi:hypothetical protein
VRVNGWILFAAIMMIVVGTMSALNGLIAIIDDEVYLVGNQNVWALDISGWGWIHLILGVITVLAAFSLLQGAIWARLVAAILAGVSIIAQVGMIQAYPFWSIAMIAIAVAVIFSVCTMGRADEEVELPM